MPRKQQAAPKSFEDAMTELEQILADIEAGQIGLEESLARYERGTFLIQHCRGVLGAAEKRIEILSKGADGSMQSQPLEDAS
jgi:exodeoxyribonuclease VII small subunit